MSDGHTPGPWIANSKDCRVYGNDGSPIADALQWSHPIQQTYNLYLIAAAPDLLEALKRAEPALWIMATSGHADAVAVHAECRAAIARAEGGQS